MSDHTVDKSALHLGTAEYFAFLKDAARSYQQAGGFRVQASTDLTVTKFDRLGEAEFAQARQAVAEN